MTKQMNLFDWKPKAVVIPFPTSCRADKVRRCVDELLRKNGAAADAYWQKTAKRVVEEMIGKGVTRAMAEEEARRFHAAIQAEIMRRYARPYVGGSDPRGAA